MVEVVGAARTVHEAAQLHPPVAEVGGGRRSSSPDHRPLLVGCRRWLPRPQWLVHVHLRGVGPSSDRRRPSSPGMAAAAPVGATGPRAVRAPSVPQYPVRGRSTRRRPHSSDPGRSVVRNVERSWWRSGRLVGPGLVASLGDHRSPTGGSRVAGSCVVTARAVTAPSSTVSPECLSGAARDERPARGFSDGRSAQPAAVRLATRRALPTVSPVRQRTGVTRRAQQRCGGQVPQHTAHHVPASVMRVA
jgi:hypothetical protein